MSLKRPFVPKSDVKQLFTTTTTYSETPCITLLVWFYSRADWNGLNEAIIDYD